MNKPVVHYDINETKYIMVGFPAMIHPIDHPSPYVSNETIAETTQVISLDGYDFETQNTKYVGIEREVEDVSPV